MIPKLMVFLLPAFVVAQVCAQNVDPLKGELPRAPAAEYDILSIDLPVTFRATIDADHEVGPAIRWELTNDSDMPIWMPVIFSPDEANVPLPHRLIGPPSTLYLWWKELAYLDFIEGAKKTGYRRIAPGDKVSGEVPLVAREQETPVAMYNPFVIPSVLPRAGLFADTLEQKPLVIESITSVVLGIEVCLFDPETGENPRITWNNLGWLRLAVAATKERRTSAVEWQPAIHRFAQVALDKPLTLPTPVTVFVDPDELSPPDLPEGEK